jgi:hypothetical protein
LAAFDKRSIIEERRGWCNPSREGHDHNYSFFPDADELTDLPPHVVGPVLLKLELPRQQQAGVQIEAVLDTPILDVQQGRDWPFHKKQAALRASASRVELAPQ